MASVSKKTTRNGEPRYVVRYRDPQGRNREKWFRRKIDADRYSVTAEADKLRGAWIDPHRSRMKLADWAEEWLTTKAHRKPKTVAGYSSLLRNHVIPRFGHRELGQIRTSAINAWLGDLQQRGLSPSRIGQAYQVLNASLDAALEDDRLAKNPAKAARRNLPSIEGREMLFLTDDQVQALAHTIGQPWQPLIFTLAYAGLRWGEAAALRRGRCQLLQNKLHIAESLAEIGGDLHWGPPKSKKSVRWVNIPKFLVEMLAEHLYRETEDDPDAPVFTSPNGSPLRHSNFYSRVWRPAVLNADVPDNLRIHDLRHTSAAFMISEGAGLLLVGQQLGHSSVVVTQRYAHLYPSAGEDLAARLDSRYRRSHGPGVGFARG